MVENNSFTKLGEGLSEKTRRPAPPPPLEEEPEEEEDVGPCAAIAKNSG